MNATEIKNVITMIKNRPSLCEALASALGPYLQPKTDANDVKADAQYLTAKQVGAIIGKSASWVKMNFDMFEGVKSNSGRWYFAEWTEPDGMSHIRKLHANYICMKLNVNN